MKRSTFLAILVIALCIVTGLLISCESKSGQLSKIQPEKVVILETFVRMTGEMQKYRVKRYEKGVIDIIYDFRPLNVGDTVLYKFPN